MFKKIFGRGSEGGSTVSSTGRTGGKSSGQPSAAATQRTINSIQQLAETEELLTKRRDLLEKKIGIELQRAKDASAAKNKRGALAALKKKKLLENQLEATENNISRINEQQGMLEEQRAQVVQLQAMRNAAQASKQTMQELDIGSVDKVLDEINEQADQMAQIQDAMSQPMGGAAAIDDDDLLAELEELDAQELDNQLLEPAPVPSTRVPQRVQPVAQNAQAMPSVPNRKVPAKPAKTAEELELEQLEAEMAQVPRPPSACQAHKRAPTEIPEECVRVKLVDVMSEDRIPGTRKPYRISKPREKWTDEEHSRFVSAINQHGRNWRKIVQEVGTRSVAQVRSHAQKYFLKLEKNGNTEEVPPARAKRPSNKPYPIKGSIAEGSHRSSQSSQPPEIKRPRRTERAMTKPLHTDFTLLEESPGLSADTDSIAFLLSEEGNGSNNNAAFASATPTTANTRHNNSGSNNPGSSSAVQRQSSALSTADLNTAACLAEEDVPCSDSKFFPETSFGEREHSDPADASSGAGGRPEQSGAPNYGEFYNAVGKVFTSHQGSNQQLMQQLGPSQRSELVHMLDHLTGEMRDSVTSRDLVDSSPLLQEQPIGFAQCPLPLGLPQPDILTQAGPSNFSTLGSIPNGRTAGNYSLLDGPSEAATAPARTQSSGLLILEAQPPDLDSSAWKLGPSGDLGAFLPSTMRDCSGPYPPSQLIDSKVFDY